MTDIQEWAMAEARRIWREVCLGSVYAPLSRVKAIETLARALVATAARVERETRQSAKSVLLNEDYGWAISGAPHIVRYECLTAIAALPLKYQEPDNG